MKTIIKGGKNEFVGHCRWCGCDFRYTEEDVLHANDDVSCPHCNRLLKHLGEHGTGFGMYGVGWQQAAYSATAQNSHALSMAAQAEAERFKKGDQTGGNR